MDEEPTCYAHSLPPPSSRADWEPLAEHLTRVADGDGKSLWGAAQFAEVFGASEWGRLLGLWHDLGKYSKAFQDYLSASTEVGDDVHRSDVVGVVDHSTAGAQHAAQLGPLGRILAYCIAGHHAGLPDNVGGDASLRMRLEKVVDPISAAPSELLSQPLPSPPKLRPGGDRHRDAFAVAFFTRMLFSCLVDADFLATEWFMDPARAAQRPVGAASAAELLRALRESLDHKQHCAADTSVNRHRREVLSSCLERAALAPGFFSLNVPTGGGKTLSSLAFALDHAEVHGLRRVVYAIPFTSIIEQTADVFREALGSLRDDVLEHHSNLEPDDPSRQTDRSRLAAENFDAPVVVTTNVQLFESLFASRTSRCRKLHRLAKSVVILDEAQTLPTNLLEPTLAALDELVRNYGSTVVLCTATQPAVERRERFSIGLEGVRPIIDEPRKLHVAMRRTCVERVGTLTNETLVERLRKVKQVLCIVNSRRHAADLFRLLDDADACHLSASMCPAHRSDTIAKIRRRLDPSLNETCRVVSTQVIEAGVDIDFPAVYRAAAGLDSIAQAAGRCNREGMLRDQGGALMLGRVVVFDYDAKTYPTERMIETGAAHFREIAPDHAEDLLGPAAIEAYFRLHYWQQGGDDHGWDRGNGRQSVMNCFGGEDGDPLHHQFRQAADAYRLIDDSQTPILVPYGQRGQELIRELESMPESVEPSRLRRFDRAAQRYVVGVYDRAFSTLFSNQVLLESHGRYYLANPAAYDASLGLVPGVCGLNPEMMVV